MEPLRSEGKKAQFLQDVFVKWIDFLKTQTEKEHWQSIEPALPRHSTHLIRKTHPEWSTQDVMTADLVDQYGSEMPSEMRQMLEEGAPVENILDEQAAVRVIPYVN